MQRAKKPYRLSRDAWKRHDRRVELGLLEVAARLPNTDEAELESVVSEVDARGVISAFATLAAEIEREDQRTADALCAENPSESLAALTRARVWREISRLLPLAPLGVDLKFTRGSALPEVVLDALAEYLVGVWVDRRRPDDQKDLAP